MYNSWMKGKVAIVHDWLNGMRGGEKVVEQILRIYPDADIFTLFYEPGKISSLIRSRNVYPSTLNRYAFVRKHYRYFLPLLPSHIEDFNLQDYDLVISSSHCVAKGAVPAPESLHICYIHSPMRYAWDQYTSYFPQKKGWKKRFIRSRISKLRQWDVASSSRVDHFIANSNYVAKRVWKYYRREAEVIHPPVDTDFFQPAPNPSRDFYLLVSALVPYKRIDLLIHAFEGTGRRLRIVGTGTEENALKGMAGKEVDFLGFQSGDTLRSLYQDARAVVFAGIEDFGIFFAEALACGTPVVAYGSGGVLDVVEPGRHGVLFNEQTPSAIEKALMEFEDWTPDSHRLRERSLEFSCERFREKLSVFIEGKRS